MASSKMVIAKYERGGLTFEILVNSDLAFDYVNGKGTDPLKVVEAEEIFKDARKGERQSPEKIQKVFGTTDLGKVIDTILKHGNVPITTEQRNKFIEEKRKQIIAIIAKNSIDPRTKAPNPPLRIENAMREAKISIDPFKSANEQIDDVVKKINALIPIKFAVAKMEVTIPADAANGCYGILKQYGLKSEKWLQDGSLNAVVEFPAGMQGEFFDRINKATQGRVETKLIEN
ncbi:MAG: ribosome assembly factor SBDS [Candidatus Marsarchaeota archaeon]|nr:ribosome assembly factor SBDS [Candidatus Marsarchaeota archaeon]